MEHHIVGSDTAVSRPRIAPVGVPSVRFRPLVAASDIGASSFDAAERADQAGLEQLRAAGVEVVLLSDAELAAFTRAARGDVWPKIADQIGPDAMEQLNAHLGLTQ